MIVKLNEPALYALGFDAAGVAAMRHLIRQVGVVIGGQTLPETVDLVNLLDGVDSGAQAAELRKDVESLTATVETIERAAHVAELQQRIAELQSQMEGFTTAKADLAEMRKFAHSVEVERAFPAPLTDWEHPGKLGDKTANSAAVTTLSASGQITSTVATGNPPLVVASTDEVANLHAALATTAQSLDGAGSYPANATDLATAITLVNAIKTRIINRGI